MTRGQAAKLLYTRPVEIGRLAGFERLTDLHNDWIIGMLRDGADSTLQAHRGSYKTTCVSIALAILVVARPNLRILFLRKTDNDVKEVIKQVQKLLGDPHMMYVVRCLYGVDVRLTTASATELATNLTTDPRGTAQLVGMGVNGSLTGKHFDRIFTDDIVNVQDRVSKAERDHTKLIYQELQNIRNRGGRIYNTGTPWHKEDCFSIMPPADMYDCYSTGLMTDKEIADIKGSMTASLFAANYELRHVASDDVIFPDPVTGGDPAMVEQGDCHIDAAYGGEDYTAFTICRKYESKYYIYGRLWRRHVDDCLDEIQRLRAAFNAGRILCEDNGDKGYLGKELRRRGERVRVYNDSTNKFLKITTYLKAEWRNVVFVTGTDPEYINQICGYNEDAEHDDAPDSAASMVRRLWRRGEGEALPDNDIFGGRL